MAKAKYINVSLNSEKSIRDAIKYLQNYKTSLNTKVETFLNRLADEGISIAKENLGYYGDCIEISKYDDSSGLDFTVVISASDSKKVTSVWYSGDGTKSATISPVLMAEFGAGWLAEVQTYPVTGNKPSGVGRGTFPGQTHAMQHDWFWTPVGTSEVQRASEHTDEMTPTHPMYKATDKMFRSVKTIAKEVFG